MIRSPGSPCEVTVAPNSAASPRPKRNTRTPCSTSTRARSSSNHPLLAGLRVYSDLSGISGKNSEDTSDEQVELLHVVPQELACGV